MDCNRFTSLADACRKHGARADKLEKYLRQADPPADDLVALFSRLPPGQGARMLDRALAHGVGPKDPDDLRGFFAAVEDVPLWLDEGLLDLGSRTYLRCGIVCGLVLACSCLPLAYRSGAASKPLMFSSQLIERAVRRLGETNRFFLEICAPDGLKRHSPGWKITVKVRTMHAQMRRLLRQGRTKPWREAEWGAPINQMDLAATSLLFSVSQLRHLRRVGFHFTAAESEGVMHLWRYAGHLLGIVPDLNCATEREGRGLQQLLFDAYDGPDDDSIRLTESLMKIAAPALLASGLPGLLPGDAHGKPRGLLGRLSRGLAQFLACRVQSEAFKGHLSRFCYGLSHGILGREFAASLRYPTTAWRYTAPALLRSVVAPLEACRRLIPGGTLWAARIGHRHLRHMMQTRAFAPRPTFRQLTEAVAPPPGPPEPSGGPTDAK